MIESGTLLQNRYLIEKQIGAGGMGAVYLAIDQRFDSKVAIKETFYKDDELGEAFEREAKLLNSLLHPALPHVSDYFAENNGYFLVMQFIEGEDLFEVLKRDGAFPMKDVLRWADSLLDALDYLHSQEPPIIHRDIKPQNLKITPRGDVILLDFGLAKLSTEDTAAVKSIFGYSRKYSPLEQIQGTGTDARSDIFALAATVFHLLTGTPPIDALARASAIVGGNPDPLHPANEINSEIPIDVASVLHSALALNADKRFASAKAMRLALEHAVNAVQIENKEVAPQTGAIITSDGNDASDSAKTEDFVALESFAAETNDSTQIDEDANSDNYEKSAPAVVPASDTVVSAPPSPVQVVRKRYVNGMMTNIVPRSKPQSIRFAAVAVLLVSSALAVLYFMAQANSSSDLGENTSVQTGDKSKPDSKDSKVVSAQPTKKSGDGDLLDDSEETKNEFSSTGKTNEKKEGDGKTSTPVEKMEKPVVETESSQISDSTLAEIPRRRAAQKTNQVTTDNGEREEVTVPDIESVFTGRSSDQSDETKPQKDERKQQKNEWTEEEVQEMRRQRKEEKKRPSKTPMPF